MSKVFVDTSFFVALLNPADHFHSSASRLAPSLDRAVTSDWIIAELGNGLSSAGNRKLFVNLIRRLRYHSRIEMIEARRHDLEEAIDLFSQRGDKEWSLIDCASFNLMSRLKISDALTTDHHFVQAGFNALLIP